MIRVLLGCAALSALMACQSGVPDSGARFDAEQARRDAALAQPPTQATIPAAPGVSQTALPSNPATAPLPSSVTSAVQGDDASEVQAAAQAAAANSGVAPIQASPSNPSPDTASISSEQDFGAVSSQRSIQSDAQQIATNRAQYTVVTPTALPTRSGGEQPNIVAYALNTKHPIGTQLYRRSRLRSASRQVAACAAFPSPDQAQIAFLTQGGPNKDRKGLDPDGDGFACSWDPAPFRNARQSAVPTPQPTVTQPAADGITLPEQSSVVTSTPASQAVAQSQQVSPVGIAPPLAISSE